MTFYNRRFKASNILYKISNPFCIFMILSGFMFSGCGTAEKDNVLAGSGEEQVTEEELFSYLEFYAFSDLTSAEDYSKEGGRRRAAADLLAERYLAGEAKARKLDLKTDINRRLTDIEKEVLLGVAAWKAYRQDNATNDEELEKYYNDHKQEFLKPESVWFRRLFLRVRDESERGDKAKLANQILDEVRSGKSFSDLINEYSDSEREPRDMAVAAARGKFDPQIEEILFSLPEKQISDIIPIKYGFLIIEVVKIEKEIMPSLDEIKKQVVSKVLSDKKNRRREKIETELAEKWPADVDLSPFNQEDLDFEAVVCRVANQEIQLKQVWTGLNPKPVIPLEKSDIQRLESRINSLAKGERILAWAREQNFDELYKYKAILAAKQNRYLSLCLMDNIMESGNPGSEVLEEVYSANPEKFVEPREYKVREIFLKIPDQKLFEVPADFILEREKIRDGMSGLLSRIKSGADFQEVAKKYSEGESAAEGGDQGWAPYGNRGRLLDMTVEKLSPGEISDVQEGRTGYHIFFLEAVRPERQLNFKEAGELVLKEWQRIQTEKAQTVMIDKAYETMKPKFNEKNMREFESRQDVPWLR
jgi:parvulin-like peptidyl-prolyl isomerase